MLLVGSSTSAPPGILPGQLRIPGTRMPPSQFVDFPAAQQKNKVQGVKTVLSVSGLESVLEARYA